MKQTEESFLGEEGIINLADIQYGKLNIIDAPCGSGKTTFVEEKLWKEAYWGDLLYLIDTKNALEAFKIRGEQKEYNGQIYYKHKGITAMTYATFAMLCIYNKNGIWDEELDLIVCDELQSAIKWSHIKTDETLQRINLHEVALAELHRRIEIGARLVSITATPYRIKQEFSSEYVNVPIHGKLKEYRSKEIRLFLNIQTLLPLLPSDKRGVIYVSHVKQMMEIVRDLRARGISSNGFWSINNEDHPMSQEQLQLRESVVKHGVIPKDIQVLVINEASQTGLNIHSDIDYVVVNDTDPDTQIQARGRVRHDIDTLYKRDIGSEKYTYIRIGKLNPHWLGRKLYEEDKIALYTELNIRDERGRLLKWPSIQRSLRFSGFHVTNKQDKNGYRYSIISG